MIKYNKTALWATLCVLLCLASCGKADRFRWEKKTDGMTLLENGEILGTLEIPDVQGISHKERIEALDSNTFKATYTDGVLDMEASAANASTAMISIMFIVIAIIFGMMVYRRNASLTVSTIAGVAAIVICMAIGYNFHPIYLSGSTWMVIVGIYIAIASVTPVWILLQPRDYLSSFLLYGMMIIAVLGIVGALAEEGVYAGSTQVIDQSLLDGVLVTSRRNGIVE